MTEIQDKKVLKELKEKGKGVCLIKCYDEKKQKHVFGTGFHFGSGWVMSAAHNFQADTDTDGLHSLLKTAIVTFSTDTSPDEFPCEKRTALIHRLRAGKEVDLKNLDIAMVKLGRQPHYGNSKPETWESNEMKCMTNKPIFAEIHHNKPEDVNTLYSMHYDDEDNQVVFKKYTVDSVDPNHINTFKLQGAVADGASGSPVLDEEYKLVGLLFGGNNDKDTSRVLSWENGILPFIHAGQPIIAEIGAYIAFINSADKRRLTNSRILKRAQESLGKLQKSANEGRLTIYLPNGEIVQRKEHEPSEKIPDKDNAFESSGPFSCCCEDTTSCLEDLASRITNLESHLETKLNEIQSKQHVIEASLCKLREDNMKLINLIASYNEAKLTGVEKQTNK